MKFLKGFTFGAIAGFAAGVAISEERRVALIRQMRTVARQAGGVEPSEPRRPTTDLASHAAAS